MNINTINYATNGNTYIAITDGQDIVINLCPHDVNIVLGETTLTVPVSGHLARCTAITVRSGKTILGVPVSHTELGEVTGLPEEFPGIYYIVSGLIQSKCVNRTDLLIPNETVRNDKGQIIGCTSLAESR